MTFFHQFSVCAASLGEGLHPKLRALLERAAVSPFSEVSMRPDGLIQAGPSPDSGNRLITCQRDFIFAIVGLRRRAFPGSEPVAFSRSSSGEP